MGDLDRLSPKVIKELFAQHFPEAPIPTDFNDCMNEQWPAINGKKLKFEDYAAFDLRVREITKKTLQDYSGQTIGLCTHTENIRNLVMNSVGTKEFFETEFGKSVLAKIEARKGEKIADGELFGKTLGRLGLVRGDFKPNDAASMNLSADSKEHILRLHDTKQFIIL